jgi:hypothetical protein
MNREMMIDILKQYECYVTFTKADGTERILHCTLKEDELPVGDNTYLVDGKPVVKRQHKVNEEVIAAWDLDNKGWRSFRVDSVLVFTHCGEFI